MQEYFFMATSDQDPSASRGPSCEQSSDDAPQPDIAWQWSVADEPDANAFSLPDGYVYRA